jgi:hypothetical protein
MILIVGLGLAAVLRVVIPLGSKDEQNWSVVLASGLACLAAAALLLYFWVVVLELFIRMAPFQSYDGVIYGQAAFPVGTMSYVGGDMPVLQQQQQFQQQHYGQYVYQHGTARMMR